MTESFVPKDLPIPLNFDVVIVGAGAAGLYAALCFPAHLRILLISKDQLKIGASDWAQGGVAAAIAADDSPRFHLDDTLKAGAGLCDRSAVDFLVNHAEESIADLIHLGVTFDRHGSELAVTLEAAHSHARVLHAADTTGRAIVSILTARVLERENIQVLPQALGLELAIADNGHCVGLQVLHGQRIFTVASAMVVLATGGGGQVFAQTTNPPVSTGDGVALAWRAGAMVRDLEFFQFHPTSLCKAGAPHFLISEAVRGEGAHLIDRQGERFAFNYHSAGELAPRDVVSRAIFKHLLATEAEPSQSHVWLDLRHLDRDRVQYRFPNIIRMCQKWGVDLFKEPIPVTPAAHYWMGGIGVDVTNQSSIPGLFAIGETASTGVHGANRLASNSLLECLVYASQFRHGHFTQPESVSPKPPQWVPLDLGFDPHHQATWHQIRQELPRLMWNSAGISRTQHLLETAIAQVQQWQGVLRPPGGYPPPQWGPEPRVYGLANSHQGQALKQWIEVRNLVDVAYLILKSAHFRQESRGGHYRQDYPESDRHWQGHTLITGEQWHLGETH